MQWNQELAGLVAVVESCSILGIGASDVRLSFSGPLCEKYQQHSTLSKMILFCMVGLVFVQIIDPYIT